MRTRLQRLKTKCRHLVTDLGRYTKVFAGSATKGVGMAQPGEWQDCAKALDHDELKGVVMPKGRLEQMNPPGAYLQYNEVSLNAFLGVV